jgi:hypothetical protein
MGDYTVQNIYLRTVLHENSSKWIVKSTKGISPIADRVKPTAYFIFTSLVKKTVRRFFSWQIEVKRTACGE